MVLFVLRIDVVSDCFVWGCFVWWGCGVRCRYYVGDVRQAHVIRNCHVAGGVEVGVGVHLFVVPIEEVAGVELLLGDVGFGEGDEALVVVIGRGEL